VTGSTVLACLDRDGRARALPEGALGDARPASGG
jgi:hypothetical protein